LFKLTGEGASKLIAALKISDEAIGSGIQDKGVERSRLAGGEKEGNLRKMVEFIMDATGGNRSSINEPRTKGSGPIAGKTEAPRLMQ